MYYNVDYMHHVLYSCSCISVFVFLIYLEIFTIFDFVGRKKNNQKISQMSDLVTFIFDPCLTL